MSGVSSVGAFGSATTLTGDVKINSGNAFIGVGTATPDNAVVLSFINTGFTSFVAGSNTLTGGSVGFLAGSSNITIVADTLGNTLTFDSTGVGGGNWSWQGAFNTTTATTYALNDVVFDSVNTTDTYICITGYTTTVPTPTPPSSDATNWLLFATQGGSSGGSSITNAGASVAVGSGGGITSITTGSDDFIVNTKTGSATGNIILSANGVNTFGSANINIQNDSVATLTMDTTNGGTTALISPFFNVGGASNATVLNVSGVSEIALLNSGTSDSASLTMFNDQSNTFRSVLNTTSVAGYTPTVTGADNMVALQGGGSNSNAYADFGAGSFQILGQSATPLAPATGASVPFITASQTGAGTASNAVVMTLSAGGSGVASNATNINLVADTLTLNGAPIASGGSSITNGGAIVSCGSNGDITMTGGITGSNIGNITITSGANATAGNGFLTLASAGVLQLNTSTAGSAGLDFYTQNTRSFFDDAGSGSNASGVITFSTNDSNASLLTIGGTSNATGLFVGASNITFNGTALGGDASKILLDGASLGLDNLGSLAYTSPNTASNVNQITFVTQVPTTTPGSNAGLITIGSSIDSNADMASFMTLSANGAIALSADVVSGSNINNINLSVSASSNTNSGIIKIDADKVLDLVVGSGGATLGTLSGDSNAPLIITPSQGNASYKGGGALYNCGAFDDQAGYGIGSVVLEGTTSYIALNTVVPNAVSPYNPQPSADATNWQPLGGGTSSGISGITINGGTAYPTSGNTINFIPGSGITMSNTGSNTINISASASGTGAYLTNNASTWEWVGSNSYATTQGVVAYQGGLYANVLAPSSNVAPFGASNSTTEWAGLAPSLSISPATLSASNILPLQSSASNAYTYVLKPATGSAVSISSSGTGLIEFDVAPPGIIVPSGSNIPPATGTGAWTFQSTASNIVITSPSAGTIDFNVDAPAMNYSALWATDDVYQVDDVVLYGGFSWVCLVITTAGESPDTTPASWRQLGAVPTGISSQPPNQEAGIISNPCLVANTGFASWNNDATYMAGNMVADTNGSVYTALGSNVGVLPSGSPGSNASWVNTGYIPVASSLQLQTGSNVAITNTGGSKATPLDFFDFTSPLIQNGLGNPTSGGCSATWTGSGTLTIGSWSNSGNIVSAQLFDTIGTPPSNTSSYSVPTFFRTPLPYGDSTTTTIPLFTCSITTINGTPSPYSLYLQTDDSGIGDVTSGAITGVMSYQFSGTGVNNTFA